MASKPPRVIDRAWVPPADWTPVGAAWEKAAHAHGREITVRVQCGPLGWEVVVYGLEPSIAMASYGQQTGDRSLFEARRWVSAWRPPEPGESWPKWVAPKPISE